MLFRTVMTAFTCGIVVLAVQHPNTDHLPAKSSSSSAPLTFGAAEGFAQGVVGGGGASPVYPQSNRELVAFLGDAAARVIVLTQT